MSPTTPNQARRARRGCSMFSPSNLALGLAVAAWTEFRPGFPAFGAVVQVVQVFLELVRKIITWAPHGGGRPTPLCGGTRGCRNSNPLDFPVCLDGHLKKGLNRR